MVGFVGGIWCWREDDTECVVHTLTGTGSVPSLVCRLLSSDLYNWTSLPECQPKCDLNSRDQHHNQNILCPLNNYTSDLPALFKEITWPWVSVTVTQQLSQHTCDFRWRSGVWRNSLDQPWLHPYSVSGSRWRDRSGGCWSRIVQQISVKG